MASIPANANQQRHSASRIIGWGLNHVNSEIKTTIGAALCDEWDKLTGGNSFEIFLASNPNYNATEPVTIGSIYDLAIKNGWDGQAPWPEPEPLISHSEAPPYPLDKQPPIIREALLEV
jgi:hypothetical protein